MQAVTDEIDCRLLPLVNVIIYFLQVGEKSELQNF